LRTAIERKYQIDMLKMSHANALAELAEHLWPYLPASFASYTFREAAKEAGVGEFWVHGQGISKTQALPAFLKNVYAQKLPSFDKLMIRIVQGGIDYRRRKKAPLTRESIEKLNTILLKLERKIPELWDREFLQSLPSEVVEKATAAVPADLEKQREQEASRKKRTTLAELKAKWLELLASADRQAAGYGLEALFYDLFDLFGLQPQRPYRLVGEQIDLAFRCESHDYLLESRLRKDTAQPKDCATSGARSKASRTSRGASSSPPTGSLQMRATFSKQGRISQS
jgi:hypothetical protein